MSTIPTLASALVPVFKPDPLAAESGRPAFTIWALNLEPHVEGGYFVETDRDPRRVPNPFLVDEAVTQPAHVVSQTAQGKELTRAASTSIFYLLTPKSPMGCFHRNRGRTVHTLHWGRGRYVIIHADEAMEIYDEDDGVVNTIERAIKREVKSEEESEVKSEKKSEEESEVKSEVKSGADVKIKIEEESEVESKESKDEGKKQSKKVRVETFEVGKNIEKGEKLQWIVEGGKYKASFLLPDDAEGKDSEGLLISEVCLLFGTISYRD